MNLETLVNEIKNCNSCNGYGYNYFGNGEDYDFESCDCNPFSLIIDHYTGKVIDSWHFDEMMKEYNLFVAGENL